MKNGSLLEEFRERRLLPPAPSGARLPSGAEGWMGSASSFYRGSLVGGAIGDALGCPGEGRPPEVIRKCYSSLIDFHPWHGWESGPKGTISDDTQLTMCVAEVYREHGELHPEALAERLVAWLPEGRGKREARARPPS